MIIEHASLSFQTYDLLEHDAWLSTLNIFTHKLECIRNIIPQTSGDGESLSTDNTYILFIQYSVALVLQNQSQYPYSVIVPHTGKCVEMLKK